MRASFVEKKLLSRAALMNVWQTGSDSVHMSGSPSLLSVRQNEHQPDDCELKHHSVRLLAQFSSITFPVWRGHLIRAPFLFQLTLAKWFTESLSDSAATKKLWRWKWAVAAWMLDHLVVFLCWIFSLHFKLLEAGRSYSCRKNWKRWRSEIPIKALLVH